MGKSKLGAIINCRCPQCREGAVFKSKATNLKKVIHTHEKCSVCGLRFEIEPGFFWAAMYISYGFNVAATVAIFLAINILTGSRNPMHYLIPIVLIMVVPLPLTLRYSRILLLHFFAGVKYTEKQTEWN